MNDLLTLLHKNSGIIYIEDIPRVTEILSSMLHEDSLMYWANSLGFKRMSYSQTLETAANIGTIVHETAENILRTKYFEEPSYRYYELNNSIGSFIDWYKEIEDKIEVVSMEVSLIDPNNLFRGTYDLLARINGKLYLTDFKTSNHIGYRYFLQLSAYRYLIRNNLGIEIDGCLILQLSKKERRFREYVLEFSNPDHLRFINDCEVAFHSIVYSYYHRIYIENEFKKLK